LHNRVQHHGVEGSGLQIAQFGCRTLQQLDVPEFLATANPLPQPANG
jgi:hypothetical protein